MVDTDSQTQQLPGPTDPGPDPTGPTTAGPRITREQAHDFSRLRRSRSDRYVAGVDPTIIRVAVLVAALLTLPVGPIVYAVLWAVIPKS